VAAAGHTVRLPPETVRRLLSWATADPQLAAFVDDVLIAPPAGDVDVTPMLAHAPSRTLAAILIVATGRDDALTPLLPQLAQALPGELADVAARFEADARAEARMATVASLPETLVRIDDVDLRAVIADVLGVP